MVPHDEAVQIVTSLPDVTEGTSHGRRCWKVDGSTFAWDRPFSKADIKRFGGDPVPSGPILGVTVDGLQEKEAILAAGTPGVFTIPHFDGYAAVLVQLDVVSSCDLRDLVLDGWLACAPEHLTEAYLRDHPIGDDEP